MRVIHPENESVNSFMTFKQILSSTIPQSDQFQIVIPENDRPVDRSQTVTAWRSHDKSQSGKLFGILIEPVAGIDHKMVKQKFQHTPV